MTSLVPVVRSPERRLLALLRAPLQLLQSALPDGLRPIQRLDHGFLVLDYRQRCPMEVGPWALGPGSAQLALGVPVDAVDREAPARGLWLARRWDDWKFRRHLPERFVTARTPRVSDFSFVEQGLQLELEVRSEGVRQLYLRGEAQGPLSQSLFRTPRDAESELKGWSRDIDAPALPLPRSHDIPNPLLNPDDTCLQPLLVHTLQSAAIPALLGDEIGGGIELDSVFRVARRRLDPIPLSARAYWRELQRRRRLSAPPEGACSVAG